MAQKASRTDFEAFLPILIEEVSQHLNQYKLPVKALEWFQASIKHNTANGKLNRGLSVIDTAAILRNTTYSPSTNRHEYEQLATLGWLTEILQAFFLVADDIMDDSHTRRGSPCWFRMPQVGMIAINDAFLLESTIYTILKHRFRRHPAYIDIVELFHEVSLQTEIGQMCDLLTAPEDRVDLSQFSHEKTRFIMIYKTAYYSFYLPVALALHHLQLATSLNLQQARDILIPLGVYFQVQDDFLDVYGTPEQIGKIGTDIQDNKCSWLINEAMQLANSEQRTLLQDNYGRKDINAEAKVKHIFQQLGLEERYLALEEREVAKIRQQIAAVNEEEGLRRGVFDAFLSKIYKRNK